MKLPLIIFLLVWSSATVAQESDEAVIKKIYNTALAEGKSYEYLEYITKQIGSRLSGSPGAAKAVDWTSAKMKEFADNVWLQPVMVPQWVRGAKETARILGQKKKDDLPVNICALGGSIGTGPNGITAEVVEVKNFDELKALGTEKVQGKIVFFNRPMDPTLIHTFAAYGGAVNQRGSGASEAAMYGAVGAVVRSMGSNIEDYPHTGGLRYKPDVPQIPAVAISTRHAETLSARLKANPQLKFFFQTSCEMRADVPSHNVIGELRGSDYAGEFIVVSGHLDSWDLGEGAHDDGAGCVQAMEVIRIFKTIGYKPKHTIRAVMYMNEENGLRGGQEYAKQAEQKKEKHLAAMESDAGGFTPRGFTMSVQPAVRAKIKSWKYLLEPYGLTDFDQEGGGADIGPLRSQNVPLIGFLPDSQRYFKYHHTEEDTLDKVDKRELELGAASMAALIYLIDKYGL